jgi:hypothetical protein
VGSAGPDGPVRADPPGERAPAGSDPAGIQRAVEIGEPALPAPPGGQAGAPGAGAGDEQGDDTADEQELDTLARRLWPRIQERLRGDLLVARERAGELVERY